MTRRISRGELALVERILIQTGFTLPVPSGETIVRPLSDGDMGSFSFDLDGSRNYGRTVGELEFTDTDGVKVLASLYLDTDENLYEVDLFKADFSPLRSLPE